jgi:hypothetical protein
MSDVKLSNVSQSDALETDTGELAVDAPPPAAAGHEPPVLPEETAVTAPPLTDESPGEREKRPISPKKLAANRANAQRSTGPMTPEGKEKSKLNAVKHGLTSRYFPAVIEAGTAEWEELEAVRVDLHNHHRPVGPVEELLLEKMTIEYMRYRRLVEREQLLCVHRPAYYLDIVDKLARYQTAINRQLFEAMIELERVQATRKAQEREKAKEEGEQNGESGRSSD